MPTDFDKRNAFRNLKGVKNERGYVEKYSMVIAINLTSISCVYNWRKLLKTTHTEERSFQRNSESSNIDSYLRKINLIPNKSFRYYKIYDHRFFSTH